MVIHSSTAPCKQVLFIRRVTLTVSFWSDIAFLLRILDFFFLFWQQNSISRPLTVTLCTYLSLGLSCLRSLRATAGSSGVGTRTAASPSTQGWATVLCGIPSLPCHQPTETSQLCLIWSGTNIPQSCNFPQVERILEGMKAAERKQYWNVIPLHIWNVIYYLVKPFYSTLHFIFKHFYRHALYISHYLIMEAFTMVSGQL